MYWLWLMVCVVVSVAGVNAGQKKAEDEMRPEARRVREGMRKAKPARMPHSEPPTPSRTRERETDSQERRNKRETAPPSAGKSPPAPAERSKSK